MSVISEKAEGMIESGNNVLASLEILRDSHIHVPKVLRDIRGSRPFSRLWERVALVFAGMPELDKGVFFGWIGRDIHQRRTYIFVNRFLDLKLWRDLP